MNIKYIDTGTLYEGLKGAVVNNSTRISQKNGIPYIEFTPFDEFDWVTLHFSTRDGGVSKGIYSSMNFSFDRGDDYENVYKNYELFLDTMNIKPENCVCTKQTHTTNVIAVDYNMAGMGLTRARNFDNVDGLVTNEPGLCLITYFADCVPVYFIDPVNRCIGASHSGWRGTVADITHETVQLMNRTYGSKPEDIHTFIGYRCSAGAAVAADGRVPVHGFAATSLPISVPAGWQRRRGRSRRSGPATPPRAPAG